MRVSNQLGNVHQYFHITWQKATYIEAYSLSDDIQWMSSVMKDTLMSEMCIAPSIEKSVVGRRERSVVRVNTQHYN